MTHSPNKPRLLITGGSGALGRQITRLAVTDWDVIAACWLHPDSLPAPASGAAGHRCIRLDVRQGDAVAECFRRHLPDAVIHTAGSDRSPDMERVVVDGAHHVSQAACQFGSRLVHLSTDVVFDGTRAPYRECDPPAPVHPYGQAKADAESAIIQSDADAAIVRTSLIYSLRGADHITPRLVQAAQSGERITLFTDEFRCPIWVQSLAAACLELARNEYRGVLNVAGAQRVNRWELGCGLLMAMGLTPPPNVRPGLTPEELRSTRPQDCTLDISLARRTLQTALPGLDEVVTQSLPAGKSRGSFGGKAGAMTGCSWSRP